MACDERDGRRQTAMRDRDAGVGRRGDPRRHAGDDLEAHPGRRQCARLFPAAAEHEWVAALQSNHALPIVRKGDQQRVDVTLASRLARPAALADVVQTPRFATACGLLLEAQTQRKRGLKVRETRDVKQIFGRMKSWLEKNF